MNQSQSLISQRIERLLTSSWLLCLAIVLVFSSRPASAQGRIEGVVTALNGTAIADAPVFAGLVGSSTDEATTRTDAAGEFRFQNLKAGTYLLRVAPDGFLPLERRVSVGATGSVRLDLTLVLAVAEGVTVLGRPAPEAISLNTSSDAGSRLGLTPRELPGSLELVTRDVILDRGHRTVQDAVASAVGVTVGEHPADNASFTTRGFSQTHVPVLYEGTKIPVAMAFPTDAWNLERMEILKGPSSALYGEGSVGGTVNYVLKRPDHRPQHVEGVLSYGGFNTRRVGLGIGGPLTRRGLHYRVDYSRNQSDGYIDDTPSTLQNVTSALAWDVSPRVNLQVSFDGQSSDFRSYWGTPLVPASFAAEPVKDIVETPGGLTIDRRMSRVNYNAKEDVTNSTTYWTRARARFQTPSGILIRNDFYYTPSDREWRNAETYAFNEDTGLIDRDRFFVSHHVTLVGNRVEASVQRPVGQFANRLLAGLDVNSLYFARVPFFRGGVDSVDPFNPVPGVFGPLTPKRYSEQDVQTTAFFVEDYLALRKDLKVTASLRAERIKVDHSEFTSTAGVPTHNPSGGVLDSDATFGRAFTPVTWRAGVVKDVPRDMSFYANVATAADPANADLVYGRPENFDLSKGTQFEFGAKQALARGRGEWTAAYYWIERRNLLMQTSQTTSDAVGKQSSRGVELNLSLRPTPRWQFQASMAVLDSRFDDFQETVGGLLVSRSGNRPPNVPNIVIDLRSTYRIGRERPVDVGASYRRIGDRFNGLDNSSRLLAYDLVDAFSTWTIDRYRLTFRVRNLLDEDYAAWGSNYYTTALTLGAPRSAEVSFGFRF